MKIRTQTVQLSLTFLKIVPDSFRLLLLRKKERKKGKTNKTSLFNRVLAKRETLRLALCVFFVCQIPIFSRAWFFGFSLLCRHIASNSI